MFWDVGKDMASSSVGPDPEILHCRVIRVNGGSGLGPADRFGTVWFGQIWVGNGTGYFDNKGSSSALAVVEDVRGDGYAHAHGEMVPGKSGPFTSCKKTGLLGAQRATLRIGNLFIYTIVTGHPLFR